MIRGPRGVLAFCALAASLAAGGFVAARTGFAGAYGAGPYSFPHQPHLSPATIAAGLAEAAAIDRSGTRTGGGGTVDRECRVCHDFAKGPETHLAGCDACHVGPKHLEQQVAPAPATASSFPHKEHLKDPSLTCFSCHRVQKEMGWIEFTLPEGGLGTAGTGGRPGGRHGEWTCTDCHRAHEPAGGLVKKDDVTGDGKPCGVCHMGAAQILPLKWRTGARSVPNPGNDRSFLHGDHGGAAGTCETCHAQVRNSKTIWDYDPVAGTAQACAACHMDAEKKPLVGVASPGRTTRVPFVAFSRFPHDRHLATPEQKIETSGKVTDGCRTCHYPENDASASRLFPGRKASPEPVGRSALVDYDACVPCHQAWAAPGHGVGAWACFKCHSGSADPQGRLAMAKAQVQRDAISGGVRFERHAHPGVCAGAAALGDPKESGGKACAECHVGTDATIPSRLGGKTFAHDPHLPANPRNEDCLACHTTSATASWSADLERFDPHFDAPPTTSDAAGLARGCLVCHVGATKAQLGIQPVSKVVNEFDHKGHVNGAKWKGGAGIPCAECHVAGGAAGYTTPADVADCTRCHSHDEKQADKWARTGKKTSAPDDAKSCTFCHEEVREAVTPERVPPRTHLSLLPGKQFHDKGGDCASCHARDGTPYAYTERIRKAKVTLSIHEDPALKDAWYNQAAIAKPGADPQGRTCMSCHRFEPRGFLRALGSR